MAFFEGNKMTGGYGNGPDIINSCSVNVERGEIVSILGPNGAGKSTAMKAMLGLLNLKSGSVVINGKDISKLSVMGGRTVGIYICTTVVAVVLGLILVNLIAPGDQIGSTTREELLAAYQDRAEEKQLVAQQQREKGPLQPLVDLVPSNIFEATTNNRNMLQVIFFAIFFGIGLILIPEKKAAPVKAFFDAFNEVILKLIDLIMLAAPYGVFALLAALVVESPSLELFQALGLLSLIHI